MHKGTVIWFDRQKGYGFITNSEGRDIFVHHSNIIMDGFRYLDEGDIVDFEIGTGNDGRDQAVNVTPVITKKMVEDVLKEENLYVGNVTNALGIKGYLVVDANNVIQSSEQGMSLVELAAYAGIDTEGLAG